MKEAFERHIAQQQLFNRQHRLLLAISGGPDSVALAHLLHNAGYDLAFAHCNFKLRGKDSQADEAFCRKLAAKLDVPFYIKQFNTAEHAKRQKLSIQLAARELRYQWFEELMQQQAFDLVLTAHHGSDVVETVLMNLGRGTGIKGLKGIAQKRGRIVRPLLPFSKADIEAYLKKEKIRSRLDRSNLDDKYARNLIRLKVVPVLKKLNPSLEATFARSSRRMTQEAGLLEEYLGLKKEKLSRQTESGSVIYLKALNKENYPEPVLYYLLAPFGFNEAQAEDILSAASGSIAAGQLFASATHQATLNRGELIVKLPDTQAGTKLLMYSLKELKACPLFKTTQLKTFKRPAVNELLLDPNMLRYPLTIRGLQTGDKFRPFGMSGIKLLSDFCRQEKMSAFDKTACRVLVNGNGDIIWVIGRRSDNRYRLAENTNPILKLALI